MGFLRKRYERAWAWENERLEWLVNSAVGYFDDFEDSEMTTILKTGAFRARDVYYLVIKKLTAL